MTISLTAAMAFAIASLPAVAVAQTTDTIRVRVHNHDVVLYRAGGVGPTIILEAGGGSSHRVWNALVPGLAQHAHHIARDAPAAVVDAFIALVKRTESR